MDKFDEKVIGYESTKEILRQILDILKRPEVYKRKGISIPRGLLMESDPGLGKSLLASILMEESERKPFVFRKTSQENSFLDELRTVFAMAKEKAPSILLLEDLNLYVESNSPYVQITAFQVHLHGVLEPPARENKATVTGSRPPADLPEILPHGKSTEMEPCY